MDSFFDDITGLDFGDLSNGVLDELGALAEGWESDGDILTCPCGHIVEMDGECPEGHTSPFVKHGLI